MMTAKPISEVFGSVAGHYAESRPHYPAELTDWLAAHAPGHALAWDCACGSGQASLGLARHFARVVATDASPDQLAQAPAHPRIEWRVAPAEASGLEDGSADLVTVAQALHWFDIPRFFAEAHRVLKPGGLLAVFCYGILTVEGEAVDALVQTFYHDDVGPYWPPERMLVERGYGDVGFPYPLIAAPEIAMHADWTLQQLAGFFRSWSASARFQKERGFDPVEALWPKLAAVWGDPAMPRKIAWPLTVLAGHKAGSSR
jgi:SAM-dependent methyltransferase